MIILNNINITKMLPAKLTVKFALDKISPLSEARGNVDEQENH